MGCDIHASVERRGVGNDDYGWSEVAHLDLPRHYRMFSAMVDGFCRDHDNLGGVAPERGFPAGTDVRPMLDDSGCYDSASGGSHTPSWLTPEEFRAAIGRVGQDEAWAEYLALADYLDSLARYGQARLVFSFDN